MADKNKKRIMIIDTNMISAIDTAGLLEKSGYEVAMVAKPKDFRTNIIRDNMPLDLIVLDSRMENFDGTRIGIDAFRDYGVESFYLCSEKLPPGFENNGEENGCAGHLKKPYNPKELITELGKFFNR